jgi:hypothetical protein
VRIHLLVEHALELETANVCLQGHGFGLDIASRRLVVLTLCQLEQLGGIGNSLRRPVNLLYRCSEPCTFAAQLLRTLLVRPDGRLFELAPDLLQPFFFLVVLKGTPEGKRYAPRDP